MFHSFFNSLARSRYLSFFSLSANFTLWLARTAKSTIRQVVFYSFFFIFMMIIRSGRLDEIRWSVCISKFQRSLCLLFSRTDAGMCIYHLFVRWNSNFLHSSQWITFSTQSCLSLFSYSFCASLLHSLNIWLIVSSLLPHNLYLLLCHVLSILVLIWLVLVALFWASIWRYSVSLLKFPFLSHVHVFSC